MGVALLGALALASALMVGLAGGIPASVVQPFRPRAAHAAEGNREQCLQWARSRGPERATLADELGRRNGLTKIHRLAESDPGSGRSLYTTADILRLCRRS
ncbi:MULTISPECIES: hypothetical protein [Aphanothece]|uniref:hypothetical protein n=1 Tax=Aphanothece TaxID=1121 RepID=UPI0039852B19